MCHPRPILGTRSSTRGLHDLRKWVFRDGTDRHTHRHTNGHGDSMTNSAQWGRVGENPAYGRQSISRPMRIVAPIPKRTEMNDFFWGGPILSNLIFFKWGSKNFEKPLFLKIVSSQTNIRNAIFDQRSTRPPEVGFLGGSPKSRCFNNLGKKLDPPFF